MYLEKSFKKSFILFFSTLVSFSWVLGVFASVINKNGQHWVAGDQFSLINENLHYQVGLTLKPKDMLYPMKVSADAFENLHFFPLLEKNENDQSTIFVESGDVDELIHANEQHEGLVIVLQGRFVVDKPFELKNTLVSMSAEAGCSFFKIDLNCGVSFGEDGKCYWHFSGDFGDPGAVVAFEGDGKLIIGGRGGIRDVAIEESDSQGFEVDALRRRVVHRDFLSGVMGDSVFLSLDNYSSVIGSDVLYREHAGANGRVQLTKKRKKATADDRRRKEAEAAERNRIIQSKQEAEDRAEKFRSRALAAGGSGGQDEDDEKKYKGKVTLSMLAELLQEMEGAKENKKRDKFKSIFEGCWSRATRGVKNSFKTFGLKGSPTEGGEYDYLHSNKGTYVTRIESLGLGIKLD